MCNESRISEKFHILNKITENKLLFHDIEIFWDAPVYG